MGFALSRPPPPAAVAVPLTLTIRNLTITPLELKLVERLDPPPLASYPSGLAKISSCLPGARHTNVTDAGTQQEEERSPSAKEDFTGLTIQPFSERSTTVLPPDRTRHEQLCLTFEDTATGHHYTAEIPGPSRRSIVLKSSRRTSAAEEGKEFTAVYLPNHAYLALFSSANLSSWMSTLDTSLPLSALSIPGTHNSPTCHVALPSVRCQAVPVVDQLNNGVRFLDVRVSCPSITTDTDGNHHIPELALVHAFFPVALTGPKYLSSLLSTLYAFLAAHPSETLLLSLKREGTGRGTDFDLSRILFTYYIPPDADKWYTLPSIPTLADCRGRIVLIRRFGLDPSLSNFSSSSSSSSSPSSTSSQARGFGIDASVWPDNVADGTCGSGLVRIQDYYGVGRAEDIQLKVRFAQEGLARAAAAAGEVMPGSGSSSSSSPVPPLFINFLSASSFFNVSCWPERIAVKMNPSIVEYLCMGHGAPGKGPGQLSIGDAATGIVVTDWVGHHGDWDLIRCIVGWNARLQLRQQRSVVPHPGGSGDEAQTCGSFQRRHYIHR
ncbi:hypothetical protein VTK56DRAFT_2827 [Thermocarpiscus australiensis]